MSSTEITKVAELSDSELDAVSGGGIDINANISTITQLNVVGVGWGNNQSNQALSVQANQSFVNIFSFFKNRQ
ncbi:MAG: hypothetical protein IRY87_12570 [Acetobacteraceae bacterium]|nr:hypothetical protein [Acetobacteraceae bacterium]